MTSGHDRRYRLLLTVPHLTNTASPYREMMALARYLPNDHFQITICSLRENGYAETAPLLEKLGCQVMVARFRPRGKTISHLWASLKDQKLIARYGPFDIQHSFDFTSSPLEALFSRIHSPRFIFSQRSLQFGSKVGIWLKIRLAHKIVAISDAIVLFLKKLGAGPDKIEKISLGIDQGEDNAKKSLAKTGARYILSVGHIQKRKRHQDAIYACARLIPEVPDLSLLIAGEVYDPDYCQELEQLADSLGIKSQVHFLGVRDDIPSLMQEASALLLCSEREPFGWVILEAMSVGLPVIASDSGGPGEIITDSLTGVLVPVGDIDGYALSLRKIILNPEWAADLAGNALDLIATKYSAQAMVAQHAVMYKNLIKKDSY